VTEFPKAPTDEGWVDLFGATKPDYLLAEPLWTWNLALIAGQLQQMDKSINPFELMQLGYKICQIFEGFEFGGTDTQVDVLAAHASLGIAMTTLPRDDMHQQWCRQKLARIESCG